MGTVLKIVIAVVISLALGGGAGFIIGKAGEDELRAEITKQKKNAEALKTAHATRLEAAQNGLAACKGGRSTLLAREHLLRSLLEMDRRNYGLASQHLGSARKQLGEAKQGAKPELAKELRQVLIEWLADASDSKLSLGEGRQDAEILAQMAALGYTGDTGTTPPAEGEAWFTPRRNNPWDRRFED